MSRYDYVMSGQLLQDDPSFYALIMAAMRKADGVNAGLLRTCWPLVWDELQARYNAPRAIPCPTDPEVTT